MHDLGNYSAWPQQVHADVAIMVILLQSLLQIDNVYLQKAWLQSYAKDK